MIIYTPVFYLLYLKPDASGMLLLPANSSTILLGLLRCCTLSEEPLRIGIECSVLLMHCNILTCNRLLCHKTKSLHRNGSTPCSRTSLFVGCASLTSNLLRMTLFWFSDPKNINFGFWYYNNNLFNLFYNPLFNQNYLS